MDVVVRDKKGPAMDLAQDEFTVMMKRQADVTCKRPAGDGDGRDGIGAGVAAEGRPGPGPSRRGGLRSPEPRWPRWRPRPPTSCGGPPPDEVVGVFVIDQALHDAGVHDRRRQASGRERRQAPRHRFLAGAVADGAARGWPYLSCGRRVRREPPGTMTAAPTAGSQHRSNARGAAATAAFQPRRSIADLPRPRPKPRATSMDALLSLVDSLGARAGQSSISRGPHDPAVREPRFRLSDRHGSRRKSPLCDDAAGLRVHSQADTKNQLINHQVDGDGVSVWRAKRDGRPEQNETLPSVRRGAHPDGPDRRLAIQGTNDLVRIQRIDEDRHSTTS